jgi:hypothetical protein
VGGFFALSFRGYTTAAIAWNATLTAADAAALGAVGTSLQEALQALPSVTTVIVAMAGAAASPAQRDASGLYNVVCRGFGAATGTPPKWVLVTFTEVPGAAGALPPVAPTVESLVGNKIVTVVRDGAADGGNGTLSRPGVAPLAVYAVPHDFRAAEEGRIEFHPLPELTPDGAAIDPAARLAGCDFDRIKLRAMEGALRVVLDPRSGAGTWLDAFEESARGWRDARRLLADEARVRVELPGAPREIVWNEIWRWLEPRRSGLDLAVSRVYRAAGGGVLWVARRAGLARTEAEQTFAACIAQPAGKRQPPWRR